MYIWYIKMLLLQVTVIQVDGNIKILILYVE